MSNRYKQGDIVFVPFPFSDDLQKSKPRPALVVSNNSLKTNVVIIAQITSNISRIEATAVFLNQSGDTLIDLPAKSVVRCHLLHSIDEKLIYKKVNELKEEKLEKVLDNIRIIFDYEG